MMISLNFFKPPKLYAKCRRSLVSLGSFFILGHTLSHTVYPVDVAAAATAAAAAAVANVAVAVARITSHTAKQCVCCLSECKSFAKYA